MSTQPGRRGWPLSWRQAAAIVGIVVCLALAVGTLAARFWLVDRVDGTAAAVDSGLGRGAQVLDTTSGGLSNLTARLDAVASAADAVAANPNGPGLVPALLARRVELSDAYESFLARYADARATALAALDRLDTLNRIVPGLSIGSRASDAFAALDERVQAVQSRISALAAAPPGGAVVAAAAPTIAAAARQGTSALGAVASRVTDARLQLAAVRGQASDAAATATTAITLVAVVLIGWLLYSALLDWLLFRAARVPARDGATVRPIADSPVAGSPIAEAPVARAAVAEAPVPPAALAETETVATPDAMPADIRPTQTQPTGAAGSDDRGSDGHA